MIFMGHCHLRFQIFLFKDGEREFKIGIDIGHKLSPELKNGKSITIFNRSKLRFRIASFGYDELHSKH